MVARTGSTWARGAAWAECGQRKTVAVKQASTDSVPNDDNHAPYNALLYHDVDTSHKMVRMKGFPVNAIACDADECQKCHCPWRRNEHQAAGKIP